MVLYDSSIQKKIKNLIDENSYAYIIPGIIGKLDIELNYVC